MIKEFKEFIQRGNVVDLAVAFILGAAFKEVVSSLVNNIIMPIVAMFFGGTRMAGLSFTLFKAKITYGAFLESVINFLIIAFSLFIIIKFINKFKRKNEEEVAVVVDKEVELLEEIRDLLKK